MIIIMVIIIMLIILLLLLIIIMIIIMIIVNIRHRELQCRDQRVPRGRALAAGAGALGRAGQEQTIV